MRKIVAILSVVLCCVMLMGAAGSRAPVLPSKNFYINDHANVIDDTEYRDAMLKTSIELFEKTGAQVVVLTVQGLGGMSVEEYAESVFNGWNIGGVDGNGALILFPVDSGHALIHAGEGLMSILTNERIKRIDKNDIEPQIKKGNYAEGLYAGFINITKSVFDQYGEKTSVATPKKKSGFGFDTNYALISVLGLLIVFRAFRVSKRYRKRHGAPYVYKRTARIRTPRNDYDDYPSGFGGAITVKQREWGGDGEEPEDSGKNINAQE